jgi:hypothetical protein
MEILVVSSRIMIQLLTLALFSQLFIWVCITNGNCRGYSLFGPEKATHSFLALKKNHLLFDIKLNFSPLLDTLHSGAFHQLNEQ